MTAPTALSGNQLIFPTPLHHDLVHAAGEFLRALPGVDTVLVTNSLARNQGTPESDVDMAALQAPGLPREQWDENEARWAEFKRGSRLLAAFEATGPFAHLHFDFFDGQYIPDTWDDGGGPDDFEVAIGNALAYAAPLYPPGEHFRMLRERWLPYYGEELHRARLEMARRWCRYDLDFIAFYQRRGLHFQAFDRLYKAFREYLQALFISQRVYPLAYNKWIRMQVVDWLGLPDLYARLPQILSLGDITGRDMLEKADRLRSLLDQLEE